MAELDRKDLSELGDAYRSRLDAELKPSAPDKSVDWEMRLATFGLRRKRMQVRDLPTIEPDALSGIGDALRRDLDSELKPTAPIRQIDWGMLLSAAEIRRAVAQRAEQLGPLKRTAFVLILLTPLVVLIWLVAVALSTRT